MSARAATGGHTVDRKQLEELRAFYEFMLRARIAGERLRAQVLEVTDQRRGQLALERVAHEERMYRATAELLNTLEVTNDGKPATH